MNIVRKISAFLVVALLPLTAFAIESDPLTRFIGNVITQIINPIIALLFALALYFFVNGIAGYILKSDDPKERSKGTQHLLWGVIGFFIMVSVTAILATLTNTFCGSPFCGGLGNNLPN